jgi:hypothetical protein
LSFYGIQRLGELYVDGNNLGGSLPQTDEPLYTGIQTFVIKSNSFEGRFPTEQFEKTTKLSEFGAWGGFFLRQVFQLTFFMTNLPI